MELKCLKCGGKVVKDDWFESTVRNGKVYEGNVGYCEKCGAEHTWMDIYEYTETDDVLMEEF